MSVHWVWRLAPLAALNIGDSGTGSPAIGAIRRTSGSLSVYQRGLPLILNLRIGS
jgi:hypothetical protein